VAGDPAAGLSDLAVLEREALQLEHAGRAARVELDEIHALVARLRDDVPMPPTLRLMLGRSADRVVAIEDERDRVAALIENLPRPAATH